MASCKTCTKDFRSINESSTECAACERAHSKRVCRTCKFTKGKKCFSKNQGECMQCASKDDEKAYDDEKIRDYEAEKRAKEKRIVKCQEAIAEKQRSIKSLQRRIKEADELIAMIKAKRAKQESD